MQTLSVIEHQRKNHDVRARVLNNAAQRLVVRLVGCWQHDLSRPFTYQGSTYRVCMKCGGMARDFNLATRKNHGASFAFMPDSVLVN